MRTIQDVARRGELDRAGAMAGAALEDGLEHPMLLNLHARTLELAGRREEAAALLRRAMELDPPDPRELNALGLQLIGMERLDEALAMFDAVLAQQPRLADAHYNRGWTLEAMGELKGAEAGYRRALELQPGHLAASAGMASISSRYGDHDEARRFAAPVLRVEPNYPDAAMSVAAADLAQGAPAAAEARLRAMLADPRPAPLQKALARSLLGDALDAQGRYPHAFEAYRASGEERRRHYAARFGQGTLSMAQRLAAHFEAASPPAPRPRTGQMPDGPRAHVFLLGFPRSGTTLLEQALAGHPDVEVLSEQEPLADGLEAFLETPEGLDRLTGVGQDALNPFRDSYWRRVRAAGVNPAGKVFIDKHPLNTLKLPLIARLFPEARILLARRDPRDVVLSCFRRRFRMSGPMFDLLTLEGAAALYVAAMRMAARQQAIAPQTLRVIAHEALVADFAAQLRAVCHSLDLAWTDALLAFPERIRARAVATPSAAQLRAGLSAESVGHWRRYAPQMRPVLPVLATWVERFGYEAA